MAKAYSIDLRNKVILFIASGSSKREASRVFNIGEDTIYRWLRRAKNGNLAPKKREDFPRKMDPEQLLNYVCQHPDHTLVEIGGSLGVAYQTASKWLRRLGITRKKRPHFTKNETKRSALCLKNS